MGPISTARQCELLSRLRELFSDRARREEQIEADYARMTGECRQRWEIRLAQVTEAHRCEREDLNAKYMNRLEAARHCFESEAERIEEEQGRLMEEGERRRAAALETAEFQLRQALELAESNFAQDDRLAEEVARQATASVTGCAQQCQWLRQQAEQMLRRRRMAIPQPAPATALGQDASTARLIDAYARIAQRIQARLNELAAWKSVRFVDDGWPVLVFLVVLVGAGVTGGMSLGWQSWYWLACSLAVAVVAAVASRFVVERFIRRHARARLEELAADLASAAAVVAQAKQMVDIEHRERKEQLVRRRDKQTNSARLAWDESSRGYAAEFELHRKQIEQQLAGRKRRNKLEWDREARACRHKFPPLIKEKEAEFTGTKARLLDERHAELQTLAWNYNCAWDALVHDWQSEVGQIFAELDQMVAYCRHGFADFDSLDWTTWSPARDVPRALPFGWYRADLTSFVGGLPKVAQLKINREELRLPAVLSFPGGPSLLVEATHQGRESAVGVLQYVMLRLLTSFPAGKVRYTIIDPTGLGQNFSAFMHLADYDERLVTSRIWTESSHINQRLADLTEHMENVIQKYLRNEFASIQRYNEHAGEVAEAFQILVVANFPANFSEEATRRLISIATSGARCGVYTLVSVDMQMKFPRNFDLADLEAHANTLVWEEGRLRWKDPALCDFPLTLEPPPDGELMTEIIRAAGRHATDANRVEVPFAAVTPPQDRWWSGDSRAQIEVPLGRAGATKLQYMRLGKGTSQHVLVAGKTGSGKSNLMHALVTNLALHYSPDELVFYLVDFKKGVEFKAYATHQLPHARVIAIESEREFGLSVLQRLDFELHERGDRFRAAGVPSLAAYRDANPEAILPRLVLLVDEFQEFFVKDDRIAQESSLLLDRLVRQGRAFGIHVVLGSQTLAGAYSLARSTIGQMAVRIALQCSEADAHLILSEENTAARLLGRPGEAIYNNANGLFEGNHPFQVVWLAEHERDEYLSQISQLAARRGATCRPAIVFEGNVAADLATNEELQLLLQVPSHTGQPVRAWLGAAIAIKEPTSVVFRRQSGNHLLLVGQHEELAAGILSACIVGAAASQPRAARPLHPPQIRFVLLDGGGFESSNFHLGALLQRHLPLDLELVDATAVETAVAQLAAVVRQRLEENATFAEPVLLVIYNLARFRQLRKSDDDFGLSGIAEDDASRAGQHFRTILREGPQVGVHVLLWCDTYNNVTRWLDRATLRDIAWRVLFQMSATDSSNLMDSAAASQLGAHRAILYNDEQGALEKFRPYGVPGPDWLREAGRSLSCPRVASPVDEASAHRNGVPTEDPLPK